MSNDQTPKWQPDKNAELCTEISGFLFQHPCGMYAMYRCHRCEKPICAAHSVEQNNQTVCQSCSELPIGQPQPGPTKHWLDRDFWYDIDVDIDDRPMWFRRKGGIRQPKPGKRQKKQPFIRDNDFTDADEIGFADKGSSKQPDWENDMGAS